MSPETRAKISARMRGNRNSRGGKGKLTEDQVVEIRRLYAAREATITQLESKYQCRSIYQTLVGINWSHVPGALDPSLVARIGAENKSAGTRRWWWG